MSGSSAYGNRAPVVNPGGIRRATGDGVTSIDQAPQRHRAHPLRFGPPARHRAGPRGAASSSCSPGSPLWSPWALRASVVRVADLGARRAKRVRRPPWRAWRVYPVVLPVSANAVRLNLVPRLRPSPAVGRSVSRRREPVGRGECGPAPRSLPGGTSDPLRSRWVRFPRSTFRSGRFPLTPVPQRRASAGLPCTSAKVRGSPAGLSDSGCRAVRLAPAPYSFPFAWVRIPAGPCPRSVEGSDALSCLFGSAAVVGSACTGLCGSWRGADSTATY